MSSAVDRPLRCMVLFWLFVVLVLPLVLPLVLVLVLVLVLDRSWDCTIPARRMHGFDPSLQCDGRKGAESRPAG